METPTLSMADARVFGVLVRGPNAKPSEWARAVQMAFARRQLAGVGGLVELWEAALERFRWLRTVGDLADYAHAVLRHKSPMRMATTTS